MSGLRLAIVNSRYWPLVGEQERYLASLAAQWKQLGTEPTVLSARWGVNWPAEVTHRGVRIVRLGTAPIGGWNTYRYVRRLSRWLRCHASEFDLVHVGNLRHEAYAAMVALRKSDCPVVLRVQASGPDGDCQWHRQSRIGKRVGRRCRLADAVIAMSESTQLELVECGFEQNRVAQILPGSPSGAGRSTTARHVARQSLGEANHDLSVAEFAPVAVCVERLVGHRGLPDLLVAWKTVAARWPSARLWIVGDGPRRECYYQQLLDLELQQQVFLPGSFDELDGVFQAADLYVSPSAATESAATTLAAMAAGLPVVAIASQTNRAMMESGEDCLLVPEQCPAALSDAIGELLESPGEAMRMGETARHRVAQHYALPAIAEKHLELFERLVANRRKGRA